MLEIGMAENNGVAMIDVPYDIFYRLVSMESRVNALVDMLTNRSVLTYGDMLRILGYNKKASDVEEKDEIERMERQEYLRKVMEEKKNED